ARDPRQRLEMLADGVLRRDEQEEEVRRLAVERVEVDALRMAAERAEDALQRPQLAVRDGDSVADRSAAEALALPQDLNQALGVDLGVLAGEVNGELAQYLILVRAADVRCDRILARQDVEDLHRSTVSG